MEDTICLENEASHRSQVFRITYRGQDYKLILLERYLTRQHTELRILLDGILQKLVKKEEKWFFEHMESDQHFAQQIWRNISLRYRL